MENKYLLVITGDCNDGDNISNFTEINEDQYEFVKNMTSLLQSNKNLYFGNSDYLYKNAYNLWVKSNIMTEKEFEGFMDYCPYGEHGIHSIVAINIYEINSKQKLL